MATLPVRLLTDTPQEHLDDHNHLHETHNAHVGVVDAHHPVDIQQTVFTQGPVLAVTTGLFEVSFEHDVTILEIEARVAVAPTGSTVVVDVNKDGVTLYTTQASRPTIATATKAHTTTPDITSVSAGEAVTVDIDQKDSNDVAVNLSVIVRYTRA